MRLAPTKTKAICYTEKCKHINLIEFKLVSFWDPDGLLIGKTVSLETPVGDAPESMRIGHNEIPAYASTLYTDGASYFAGVYNNEALLGVEDDDSTGLYGYGIGEYAYSEVYVAYVYGAEYSSAIPPNRYEVEIFGYTWAGFEPQITVYANQYSGIPQEALAQFYPTEIGRTWYNLGEVPQGTQFITIKMYDLTGESGACFIIDAVRLVPIN